MRVCIVNEFFYPDSTGGTGTVLSDLARTLKDAFEDLEIEVVTSRHLYRDAATILEPQEDWDGIKIIRLATPRPSKTSVAQRLIANFLFSVAALCLLLRRKRYDLVLVGTAPPTVAMTTYLLKKLTGTPYAYIIYDLEPDRAVAMKMVGETNPLLRVIRRLQRSWLHGAARTVVLGRCMRDHLVARYRLPLANIAVIPIGADPHELVPMPRQSEFRRQHGLKDFVVLYSGNFGRYHNFDAILDAARILQTQREDITFVLVGGGAQKEHIEARVEREALHNVRMFPFVPQEAYADLLASADVSLVTLEPGMEGICVPSKFYSILASGRPTVAMMSPECEVALVISEAQCGVQLDTQDAVGLARTLSDLADRPESIERMGQNARCCLLEHYTTRHIASAYYQVFLSALNNRHSGRQDNDAAYAVVAAAAEEEPCHQEIVA